MRFRRPRFTTRRWLVITAVVAIVFAEIHLLKTSATSKAYWKEAVHHSFLIKVGSYYDKKSSRFCNVQELERKVQLNPGGTPETLRKWLDALENERKAEDKHRWLKWRCYLGVYCPWLPRPLLSPRVDESDSILTSS